MIPPILHQTWKDDAVPQRFAAYVESWRQHHPAWAYRLWTDADLAMLVDTRYPKYRDLFHSYPQPIMRADLGRYLVLQEYGGNLLNAFISSPHDRSGRIDYLQQLMSSMDVHSYGKLFRNKQLDRDLWRETKLETMRTYKFTVAFENAIAKDYVTEKFYDPLIAGSVPIYLGAPNIEDFAPGDHCFVNAAKWRPEALAEYLIELAGNEPEYARLLEWKTKPFRECFMQRLEVAKTHPFVRLCAKVEERLGALAKG